MKKLVVWAIVLILCFSISGCGNSSNEDINIIMRTNDYKEDVIKFDDIEWLTEIGEVEKKINKDLLTSTEVVKEYYEITTIDTLGYNSWWLEIKDKDNTEYNTSIGKIAEWDIVYMLLTCIEYKGNKYVDSYEILIKDIDNNTDSNIIVNDIIKKLKIKYGTEYIDKTKEEEIYDIYFRDNNNNTLSVDEKEDYVKIKYICHNVREYTDKIEQETKKERMKESSKGL